MKTVLATALLSIFVFAACLPQAEDTTVNPEAGATTELETTELQMPADGEITVVPVSGDDFKFDVTEIRAQQGQPLQVAFTNSEGFHDFVIDELNVNTGMVPMGQTVTVDIPTDQPGTYEFYCSVGEHRAQGMVGTLIIE